MYNAKVKPETKYYFICPKCGQRNAAIQHSGYKMKKERCLSVMKK